MGSPGEGLTGAPLAALFLPQLIPVFADHVLWPTLTKSGCAHPSLAGCVLHSCGPESALSHSCPL